jgi:ribosomal-protein-alanine N-acetyltransferase
MIVVRNLEKGDILAASNIEKNCLSTAWSEAQLSNLPENATYLVALCDRIVCGIGSMYCVFDDCEIMNIAVSDDFRKKGVGSAILEKLIYVATEKGCQTITLEVAENNESAIALYEKFGFAEVGKRKGFYQNADAKVMQKTILEK